MIRTLMFTGHEKLDNLFYFKMLRILNLLNVCCKYC